MFGKPLYPGLWTPQLSLVGRRSVVVGGTRKRLRDAAGNPVRNETCCCGFDNCPEAAISCWTGVEFEITGFNHIASHTCYQSFGQDCIASTQEEWLYDDLNGTYAATNQNGVVTLGVLGDYGNPGIKVKDTIHLLTFPPPPANEERFVWRLIGPHAGCGRGDCSEATEDACFADDKWLLSLAPGSNGPIPNHLVYLYYHTFVNGTHVSGPSEEGFGPAAALDTPCSACTDKNCGVPVTGIWPGNQKVVTCDDDTCTDADRGFLCTDLTVVTENT